MNIKSKRDNFTFQILLLLLFMSFFEESKLSGLSKISLISVFLIPFVIVYNFFSTNIRFNKGDKHVIIVFSLFLIIQIIGIRIEAVYFSLTQIYRTFSALLVVLYIRHFELTTKKIHSFFMLSVAMVIFGFISVILPEVPTNNIFYGNFNTVGALFFTFCILNIILYLITKKWEYVLLAICDFIIIIASNTRTALFLLLITGFLYLIINGLCKKRLNSKLFFAVMIALMLAFIAFYYNIRESGLHDKLNELSNKVFNKNFDSGRPLLWHYAVETVSSDWLFGKGTGAALSEFVTHVENSHSSFFDLYLQNGLAGVILFGLCIFTCLNEKHLTKKSKLNSLIMIIAFVIIFYNAVGIILIKPRSGIGLLHWALIAMPYFRAKTNNVNRGKSDDKSYYCGIQCQTISR